LCLDPFKAMAMIIPKKYKIALSHVQLLYAQGKYHSLPSKAFLGWDQFSTRLGFVLTPLILMSPPRIQMQSLSKLMVRCSHSLHLWLLLQLHHLVLPYIHPNLWVWKWLLKSQFFCGFSIRVGCQSAHVFWVWVSWVVIWCLV
jgi:hypothetical protein